MAGIAAGVRSVRPLKTDAEPEGTPREAGEPRRPTRRPVVVALLLIIAVLVITAGVLGWLVVSRDDDQRIRNDVLTTATAQIQTLLSYDGTNLAAAATVVDETTTGSFRDDYKRLFDESVRPNAERLGARTVARVVGAGWLGFSGADADVLVFVNQSTTTNDGERVDTVQAKVTMREVDGRWLIAGLDQV